MAKMLQSDAPREISNGCSHIILKTDLYRIAMMEFPSLFLSETCEIIDVSEKFRSCCGDITNRTFLRDCMKDTQYNALKTHIIDGNVQLFICVLHYLSYRYGVAIRIPYRNKICTLMFLTETVKDTVMLEAFLSELVSFDCFESYCNAKKSTDCGLLDSFKLLLNPYGYIYAEESIAFLRFLSAKLTKRKELFPYHPIFSVSEDVSGSKIVIHSGELALVFVSVLNVLGSVSKNGELDVNVANTEGSFSLAVSAELPYDIMLRGDTDNLTGLASHIPGSFPYLLLAEVAVLETDMLVSLHCEERKITISIECSSMSEDELSFNYRSLDDLAEYVMLLLCSVIDSNIPLIYNQQKGK